jgi:chromosome segregation ATPase
MLSVVASLLISFNVLAPSHLASDDISTTDARLETETEDQEEERERLIEAKREALEKREAALEELRERKQAVLREMEQNRDEFREKLAEIKDDRKQKVAENLADRFSSINDKWVTHWNSVLDRLSEILAKVDARADTLASEGKDVSAVKTAISAAETAISGAEEAINEQAGKIYEFEIDTEENLGQNVKAAIAEFHEDLRSVQTLIKDAREAVGGAIRALKNVVGSEQDED